MTTVDFRKKLKDPYQPSASEFILLEVPLLRFLLIDGHGDLNTARAYQEAVAALYSVAHTFKFTSKKDLRKDYVVPPLKGQWCADDTDTFRLRRDESHWCWTMKILVPDSTSDGMVEQAGAAARKKAGAPGLAGIRCEILAECLSMQIMQAIGNGMC